MPPADSTGRIVLLNGASSAGKSTIAMELLPLLDGPWFHLGIDMLHRARARGFRTPDVVERTARGFHRVVAAMAGTGNDAVVDHLLGGSWRLDDCLTVWHPYAVWTVGVMCSLPELERREHDRGNRPIGQARSHFDAVHAGMVYDIEVNTEHMDPAACAAKIAARLAAGPGTAFTALAGTALGRAAFRI